MSDLYGTLTNERGSKRTVTAHESVTATAQSYAGSVSVTIRSEKPCEEVCEGSCGAAAPCPFTARPVVYFHAERGSTAEPETCIASMPLADLLAPGVALSLLRAHTGRG